MAATAALVPHAGAGQPLSEAEQAVFLAPHLQALTLPTRLDYRFERRGAEGFEDRVSVAVQARAGGGCCSTEAHFLSGARELRLPDLPDAQANPVTLYFLERAVRDMQRRTGGQPAHFRRRIRLALADAAQVTAVTVSYRGERIPATQIDIAPYLEDPARHRFEALATMRYQFVLCPQVPGGVFQLSSRWPAAEPDGAPRVEEVLTLLPDEGPARP